MAYELSWHVIMKQIHSYMHQLTPFAKMMSVAQKSTLLPHIKWHDGCPSSWLLHGHKTVWNIWNISIIATHPIQQPCNNSMVPLWVCYQQVLSVWSSIPKHECNIFWMSGRAVSIGLCIMLLDHAFAYVLHPWHPKLHPLLAVAVFIHSSPTLPGNQVVL